MSSLYQDNIMEHYQRPRNKGTVPNPTITFYDTNPLCGDTITVTLAIDADNRVHQARHSGSGCAISQAAASMLFEVIEGKTIAEIVALDKEVLLEEFGKELSVSRLKCALLPLSALKKALVSYDKEKHHA